MRFRIVASSCLLALYTLLAHGSAKKPIYLPPQSPNTLQGVEGGFWRTDNNFDPILHLKNVLLKTPLPVTPILFFADGTEYKLPAVRLEPAGVASIDLKIAIQHAPSGLQTHISAFGMVAIAYRWAWPAVTVSIQNTDEIASLSGVSAPHGVTSVVHAQPEVATPQVIRGTWWLPTKLSDDVIALGNTGLYAKQVRFRISDNAGSLLVEKQLTLERHSSQLLHLNDLLSSNFRAGDAGDITILYAGAPHSVVASASIEDETTGYSVTPHMVEQSPDPDETVHSVTLHAPGMMLGKPEPSMLFPVDTVFTPYAVLHNVSPQPITALLSLTSGDGNRTSITRLLDTIHVDPGAILVLNMSRYFDAGHPLPDGFGHLSVSYSGKNGDLLFDTGSADQSNNYVFQVMPSLEAPTIHKIICFWSVEGDTSTMISIWNYANTPQDATLLLRYSGGQYRIPLHLGPRETYNLDMMSLVRSRVPDADGKLIPAYVTTGSATLMGPGGDLDKMTVVVSASAYNVRNGTCYPICIDCGVVVSVSVGNVNVALQNTAQATATITTESGSSTTSSGNWSSANSSIANIDSNGDVGGIALGSTSIYFSVSAPPAGMYCYQQNQTVCPYNTMEGGGTVTVVDESPVISSLSPSVWNAGTSFNIAISGQHFGTNLPSSSNQGGVQFSDSRITIPGGIYSQWTDNQIQATVNVGAGTPTETVSVTVTSSGYGGNSFNGSGAGQSAKSGPQTVTVQAKPTQVTISGPSFVPMAKSGTAGAVNSIQLTASGTPPGGTYSWSTSSSVVSLINPTSATVTVQSQSVGNANVTVKYTVNNAPASAAQPVGVLQPTSLRPVPNFATIVCPQNYKTQELLTTYTLLSQSTQALPVAGIPVVESFAPISNNCSGVANIPNASSWTTQSTGQLNADDGQAMCSPSCLPANSSGQPQGSCTYQFTQKFTANGYPVQSKTITMTCPGPPTQK